MPDWFRDLWPLWLTFFLLSIAIIGGKLGRRADQKRAYQMMEWAKNRGFEVWPRPYGGFFVPGKEPNDVTREFVNRFQNFASLSFKDRSFVGPLARGTVDGVYIEVFYITSAVRSGSQTLHFRSTAMIAAVPVSLPKMRIRPETMLSRGIAFLGTKDIQLESEDFNHRFKIEGEDEQRIREVLGYELRDFLLNQSQDRDWQISHQLIVLTEPHLQDPASLERLLEDALGFAKHIPPELMNQYPAPF